MKIKKIFVLLYVMMVVFLLAAFVDIKEPAADEGEIREIVVAAVPGYYPITYEDSYGNAAGYDVEVLKAIDEALPDYTFTFVLADKEEMIKGVQNGAYQVGVNSLFKTQVRLNTYLMPENNMGYTAVGIIQREDSDYNTFQDLYDQGAKIYATGASSGIPDIVNRWNKENPDSALEVERQMNVVYEDSLASVLSGETDAVIHLIPVFHLEENSRRAGLKISDPVAVMPTFCIVNKEETELNELIDKKLEELRKDGTLSGLSEAFFGYDVFSLS